MIRVTCRLTAKNRDQLRNPTRSVIKYGLPLHSIYCGYRSPISVDSTSGVWFPNLPHRSGNSRAIYDHTVLPATRQK